MNFNTITEIFSGIVAWILIRFIFNKIGQFLPFINHWYSWIKYILLLYELSNIFDLKRSGKVYSDLTKSFRQLCFKEVVIHNKEYDTVTITGWLTEFTVTSTGVITAKISADLAPHLLKLKEKGYYTQHLLNDTIKLNSKYAIRLYKLVREANKNKGKTTPEVSLTPYEFQELMNSPVSYSAGQFRQNILEKAIDEINKEIYDMDLNIYSEKRTKNK